MTARESALRVVEEHGYPVVPCDAEKRPLLGDWTHVTARDPGTVESLFRCPGVELVGVRTGAVSGLCVIDVDPAGAQWLAANFARLSCQRIHSTRRENGRHLYYKIPAGYRIKNSAGKLAPGVDTRGEGGQVIWWPEHGGKELEDGAPGEMPGWLLHELLRVGAADRLGVNGSAHAPEVSSKTAARLIREGGRNDALTREAGKLRRLGHSETVIGAALLALNDERCDPPLVRDEILSIARSVSRYAPAERGDRGEDDQAPAPIDWSACEGRDPPPRTWWIQDWLTPAPTLCAGAGGVGKSILWQTIAAALATGCEYLEAATKPLNVLMWACEDDRDELWRRQARICEHFGIKFPDLAGNLTVVPRYGHDNTMLDLVFGRPCFTPLAKVLSEQINDKKADVVVLDNLAQLYGGNENDRHQVTMFVNGVHGMVRDRPFASVFLGHVARSQGSEYSGSAAWENACRMRWYLGPTLPDQKQDQEEAAADDIMYLAKRKANYSMKDWCRLRFRDGLLVPEQTEGRRFDHAHQQDVAEAVVIKGLHKLESVGIKPTDGSTSPDYLPKQIFAKGFAEGFSKKELAAAMNRLMGHGRLKRGVIGEYRNRTPRLGVVEVDT
jgi:RecA-family ATPase